MEDATENLVNELLQKLNQQVADLVIEARERIELENTRHNDQIRKIRDELYDTAQPIRAEIQHVTKQIVNIKAFQIPSHFVALDSADFTMKPKA